MLCRHQHPIIAAFFRRVYFFSDEPFELAYIVEGQCDVERWADRSITFHPGNSFSDDFPAGAVDLQNRLHEQQSPVPGDGNPSVQLHVRIMGGGQAMAILYVRLFGHFYNQLIITIFTPVLKARTP